MSRFPRPRRTDQNAPAGWRQALVVVTLGGCVALGALGTEGFISARHTKAPVPDDDEIYTGSILYVPNMGDVCRQLLFDNRNGQFTDNGYVDCLQAVYRSDGDNPKQWSAARVRVISTGFRGH